MTGMENVLAMIEDLVFEGTGHHLLRDGRDGSFTPTAALLADMLSNAGFGNLHDAWADAISRVEVIDYTGRAYTKYTPAGTVSIDRQDQGRTLKVFITEGATK